MEDIMSQSFKKYFDDITMRIHFNKIPKDLIFECISLDLSENYITKIPYSWKE